MVGGERTRVSPPPGHERGRAIAGRFQGKVDFAEQERHGRAQAHEAGFERGIEGDIRAPARKRRETVCFKQRAEFGVNEEAPLGSFGGIGASDDLVVVYDDRSNGQFAVL
jgi:hypothetical protein